MQLLTGSVLKDCGVSSSDAVLIGLSGGPDSVALCHAMCMARERGLIAEVFAAHLHHGIRGADADEDVAFCQTLCQELKIPLTVERADVPAYAKAHGETLEQAARTVRYGFLRRCAAEVGASCIATGHHRDDQAETVLLHLLRGCGIGGLAGMRSRSGDLIRPLLSVSREQIEAYLAENGLPYRVDRTNADLNSTRNRIRHELLPMLRTFNPNVSEALCKTAGLCAQDEAYLEELAQRVAADAICPGGGYDRRMLADQPAAVQSRVLRILLMQLSGGDVTQADILRLSGLLTAQTGTCIQLRDGQSAWTDDGCVYIGRYPQRTDYETPFLFPGETRLPEDGLLAAEWAERFALPEDSFEAYLDAEKLPDGLTVRTRRDGDRFFPLGAPGRKTLSDFFTDRKTPRHLRDVPLLACGAEIYWVAGHTVSGLAAVTGDTKRILHIRYKQ